MKNNNNKFDVDAITAGIDLGELIGGYVDLKPNGREFEVCCPFHEEKTPSFRVVPDRGFYHCFGCDAHGDAIDFVMEYAGCTFVEACESLGGKRELPASAQSKKRASERVDYYADYPWIEPPADQRIIPGQRVDLTNPKRKNDDGTVKVWRRAEPSMVHPYTDAAGRLVGYVLRFDMQDGKITPQVCWTHAGWTIRTIPDLRPIYGLSELVANPSAQVLVVEGEKARDAAAKALADDGRVVAVSWCGGSKGTSKTDWSPLTGRNIVLWPDNDEPGRQVMVGYERKPGDFVPGIAQLSQAKSIKLVEPDQDLPKGWDVADCDWSGSADLIGWIKERIKVVDLQPEEEPPIESYSDYEHQPPADVPEDAPERAMTGDGGLIVFPDVTSKGKPKATIPNVAALLRYHDITCRYNVVSKEIEINIPGRSFLIDNAQNNAIIELETRATQADLPATCVHGIVNYLASQNYYNPVLGWIDSRGWDGTDRFPDLLATLNAKNNELAAVLLKRWLISAVAAVVQPNGQFSSKGVLVLQGEQGIGKTPWFRSLMGTNHDWFREAIVLNPSDKDSVKLAITCWIGELGELDATFRKADIAALKGFITKPLDEMRLPYGKAESKFPRRTVYGGSVNPRQYLHDETGNERFWTIECAGRIQWDHQINMQQLWAQVAAWLRAGESWRLTPEETAMLSSTNEDFEAVDPIHEKILACYDVNQLRTEQMTATDVCESIGIENPSKTQTRDASAALKKILGEEPKRKARGRVFMMPLKKISS